MLTPSDFRRDELNDRRNQPAWPDRLPCSPTVVGREQALVVSQPPLKRVDEVGMPRLESAWWHNRLPGRASVLAAVEDDTRANRDDAGTEFTSEHRRGVGDLRVSKRRRHRGNRLSEPASAPVGRLVETGEISAGQPCPADGRARETDRLLADEWQAARRRLGWRGDRNLLPVQAAIDGPVNPNALRSGRHAGGGAPPVAGVDELEGDTAHGDVADVVPGPAAIICGNQNPCRIVHALSVPRKTTLGVAAPLLTLVVLTRSNTWWGVTSRQLAAPSVVRSTRSPPSTVSTTNHAVCASTGQR